MKLDQLSLMHLPKALARKFACESFVGSQNTSKAHSLRAKACSGDLSRLPYASLLRARVLRLRDLRTRAGPHHAARSGGATEPELRRLLGEVSRDYSSCQRVPAHLEI